MDKILCFSIVFTLKDNCKCYNQLWETKSLVIKDQLFVHMLKQSLTKIDTFYCIKSLFFKMNRGVALLDKVLH